MKLNNFLGCPSNSWRIAIATTIAAATVSSLPGRESHDLNSGWVFFAGEISQPKLAEIEDIDWQPIQLPHDWSIDGERTESATSSGGGGFFPTGKGWYQHQIPFPDHWHSQRVILDLEGSMGSTTVWLNGLELARHENGYLPMRVDLTDSLVKGESNTLLVCTDTTAQPASRWYAGAGLYRPAHLDVVDPVHVPADGLYVNAMDIYEEAATMDVQASVANTGNTPVEATLKVFMISPDGIPITHSSSDLAIEPGAIAVYNPRLAIPKPQLWSPDSPVLYRAVVQVFVDGRMTDRYEDDFGIRSISTNSLEGLLINGQSVELAGANIHHDNGPLGAAAFRDAVHRKVRILKDAGFNTIRTAHNPPSRALLEACDEMGMLVINELYDGWAAPKLKNDYHRFFSDNWKTDLETWVRRDRNHPSVILWSIGNEIFERGKPETPALAADLVATVKQLDTTRPVTIGLNGLGGKRDWSELDPLFATVDVAGYNYELEKFEPDHDRVPDRVMFASESFQVNRFANWKAVQDHPWVIGEFVWSGMDYLGEAAIGRIFPSTEEVRDSWVGNHYPWHGAVCGSIDITGQRKPWSYYQQILWDADQPGLYLAVETPSPDGEGWQYARWTPPPLEHSWTWPGHEGQAMKVVVFSRYDKIRLFLDRTLVGSAEPSQDTEYKAEFTVPYQPGTLTIEALREDEILSRKVLRTAGEPVRVQLDAEPTDLVARPDKLVFVGVEIQDLAGQLHTQASVPVRYSIEGPAVIQAIGSADLSSEEAYGANPRTTYQGRSLLVLRSTGKPGIVRLTAEAPGLEPGSVVLEFAENPLRDMRR